MILLKGNGAPDLRIGMAGGERRSSRVNALGETPKGRAGRAALPERKMRDKRLKLKPPDMAV
jgi:hypothetical protein